MPRELRCVIFSKDEAIAALLNFARHRRKPIALGYARRLHIERGPPITCTLVMHNAAAEGAVAKPAGEIVHQYRFDGIEVAAALVLACIEGGIPMPATRLRKSVRAFGDQLALVMSKGVAVGSLEDLCTELHEEQSVKPAGEPARDQATCV